jgi:hypothetical protein
MRKNILLFTICLLFIPLLTLTAFLILAIETQPRVDRQATLTPEHITRAKHIIDTHRNQVAIDQLATVNILSEDADIVANYLANRFTKGSAQILAADRSAHIYLSLPIPQSLFNGYLNFEATLIQTAALPRLQSARIGNLVLPDFLTKLLVSQLIYWLQRNPNIHKGLDAIRLVQISPIKINIMYHRWNNHLLTQEMNLPVLSKKAQAQLYRYHTLLVKKSRQSNTKTISLSEILPPLMHVAAKHSINGDALEENRAVILATAIHALGISTKLFIPDAINWPRPAEQLVTLEGRRDFAKHFIASAAITAYTNTKLSDAVGLFKEIVDSRHGSGFSFKDIAANRAGTQFGKKAVASTADAQQLQQLVADGLNDVDLMPPWSDLPEHMSEKEFKARFGNINTVAYKNMMQIIENRVSMLKVLR